MPRRSFLKSAVDIHIHAGPSAANCKVDAYEMLRQAERAGHTRFLVKDHYVPSTHGYLMLEEHFGGSCQVFSSIAMNNSVGTFNVSILDYAHNMGAKVAYMPTVSSKMHINEHKGRTSHGSGGMIAEEKLTYYLDGDGKLVPEAVEVLDYMVTHPNLVLATGHDVSEETDVLLKTAFELGVRKILVNYLYFNVNTSMEWVVYRAGWGANIEIAAMEHGMVLEDWGGLFNSIDLAKRIMDSGVSKERIVIDPDFKQTVFPYPVEGLYRYLNLFYDTVGISEADLAAMVKKNPARLMGMLD